MHLVKEFRQQTASLCDLDRKITTMVCEDSFETEELLLLVDTRERILQNLLSLIEQDAELARSSQWLSAVQETKAVVELLQTKTDEVGLSLQKFRRGQRSIQQYKKFL